MTAGAARELRALPPEHRAIIDSAGGEFSAECDRYIDIGEWPTAKFRARPMKGYDGVWEMTWCFRQPDLRATFEWVEVGDPPEMRVLWRRVGKHAIFDDP